MTKADERKAIIESLREQGLEAVYGKGGFFLRGEGFVSFAKARRLAGVAVSEGLRRERREAVLYGDAAIVHLIAGRI